MIPELGQFALILAFATSLILGIVPMLGYRYQKTAWLQIAPRAANITAALIIFSFGILVYAFLTHDFSVAYVAENSNSHLPWFYRIPAVWGGHEGSLLLWMLILSIWMAAVSVCTRTLPLELGALVLSVLGLISSGFLSFILFTSNPFTRLLPYAALDGRDLNPLLQDPGLMIHPPMLYMGYVGFSVAFAFAIAALIQGRFDSAWARFARPWTIVAWMFLTVGIALGSWWAYYELGWGGWWFWDPVENASFMPWLAGTALIHSLIVCEHRGAFKAWTVLLAIFTFSLSLLGTFLVRSGVLTSVHAFANDPKRGLFILLLLAAVVGSSLILFVFRTHTVRQKVHFQWFSREVLLLSNNCLLLTACVTVLLGTTYPLILDALNLGKISVGPPYFNALFVPLALCVTFLMAFGPMSRWKHMEVRETWLRVRWRLCLAIGFGIFIPWVLAEKLKLPAALGWIFGLWLVLVMSEDVWRRAGRTFSGLSQLPRNYWGMILAHSGVAVTVIGIAMVSTYHIERDVRLAVGDHTQIGAYDFELAGLEDLTGPNYTGMQATVKVRKNGNIISTLYPEKRLYTVQKSMMSETAIDVSLWRDLYVAMGESLGQDAWSVRIYYKPFVRWIWLGALIMALGGGFAASDKRYRRLRANESQATSSEIAAEA